MGRAHFVSRPPRPILILGPHRSGTSAVARVLNLLGVALGDRLMRPKPDNRYGFWEHLEVFDLHERLLCHLGSGWSDYQPLPAGWLASNAVDAFRAQLSDFLVQEFSEAEFWGVKDPRLARLLPLWLAVFDELAWDPGFVIVVRNPLEVIASLQRRQQFPFETCLLLYMSEMLATLEHTRGRRRGFVSYSRLLDEPLATVDDLAADLGIDWPHPPHEQDHKIRSFLRPMERHHRYTVSELRSHGVVPQWCADLYDALEAASRGEPGGVDPAWRRGHDAFDNTASLLFPELDRLRGEIAELRRRAAGPGRRSLDRLRGLGAMIWRRLRPLRATARRVSRRLPGCS